MALIAMAVYDTEENNRTWMTRKTLISLATTVDWNKHRLFIVDNDSCRDTHFLYEKMRGVLPFHLLRNDENLGTAKAINLAWQHREQGEHAVKMDNDVTIAQSGWCDWMEDVFDRDPTIGICGLKRKDLQETPLEGTGILGMLPHTKGQRWLVIEEVRHVMGTCQAYNSALLDKIGYLVQPGVYGFDDSLASVRSRVAGFKNVFLHGFEIDHLDLGGDDFTAWKRQQAANYYPEYNSLVLMYESGLKGVWDDGV